MNKLSIIRRETCGYLIMIIFVSLLMPLYVEAQGLRYLRPGNAIDKRTSYQVFSYERPTFKDNLTIDFDIKFFPERSIGYVCRIMDKDDNLIYNVFLNQDKGNDFELNEEGVKTLLELDFNSKDFRFNHWYHFQLKFDLLKKNVTIRINGKQKTAHVANLPSRIQPDIVFGRSDYLIDLPAISIKNLSVKGTGSSFFFPLNQTRGNDVFDDDGHKVGRVKNPYWEMNDSYRWKLLKSVKTKGNASACFDSEVEKLFIITRDSLTSIDLYSRQQTRRQFDTLCPVDINLGMNFLDRKSGRIFVYEVFKEGKLATEPSVASLDINNLEWRAESFQQLPTQRHHHGAYYDTSTQRLFIFGGFGSMTYSDELLVYDVQKGQWSKVVLKGDVPHRYFVCLGYSQNSLYLFGGMGNASGSQSVGRKYFYDLHRIDLSTRTISNMWSIPALAKDNVVPVRSMFIDGHYFFTLCYSEFHSHSYLKLYRFDIKTGQHEVMGDSIPIRSDQISTNANIYFDANWQRVLAVVQEYNDDKTMVTKVYEINLPLISKNQYEKLTDMSTEHSKIRGSVLLIALLLVLIAVGIFIYLRRRRREPAEILNVDSETSAKPQPNAVFLFGDFKAYNRKAQDISYLFTDKLRELFCLLMQYNSQGGISSKLLGSLLWSDKAPEKLKNLRGVTINHLRKVLEEIDGISLVYQSGVFVLVVREPFYCDYLEIRKSLETDETDKVLNIALRGKFLSTMGQSTLDEFKSQTEELIIPVLTRSMKAAFEAENLKLTMRYAIAIKYNDPLNTIAHTYMVRCLRKMGRTFEAQEAIYSFDKEYVQAYNEHFQMKE